MLARLERVLPRGPEWVYEPKLDGFRGLLWRSDAGRIRLLSRNLKALSASFPELVQAAQILPLDTVVDGEIVIADAHGNSDFGALQQRLSAGRRGAAETAHERPAVLLTFDILRDAGVNLVDQPLRERRIRLERLLGDGTSCLQLMTQTTDVCEAEDWLRLLPNIEGVVAKRQNGRYRS
jgi:ATP-dependent DNA ligase